MKIINGLSITQTTAKKKNAETDDDFEIQITRSAAPDLVRKMPDLPYDEREQGRTDQYFFDLTGENVDVDESGFSVIMRALGGNAWIPSSIFVIGHTDASSVLLGSHPNWPVGQNFSNEASDTDAAPEHAITGFTT